MTDVLDAERIQRFRTIRNDLLKRRDAAAIRLDHMRELRIKTERELRELDLDIGVATRNLRKAEKPLSEYIAEIVKEEDAGRGYYAMVLADANRRKNADLLRSTNAVMPKAYQEA
jgi:hypothetical protein